MLVSMVTRGGEINGVRQSSRKKSEKFLTCEQAHNLQRYSSHEKPKSSS
jgi:hypothetical protein